MFKLLGPFTIALLLALPAIGEPYRLISGDRIVVNSGFLDEPKTMSIDLDGNIRLPQLGSISASGKTLDQLQDAIVAKMTMEGFSGQSLVLVEVEAYAPIVVSGIVERSGRFDFLPGMDVGTALALAGGVGSDEVVGPNADVLAVNAQRRAATATEQIAVATSDIALFEAALAGPDVAIELSDTQRANVPIGARNSMDDRIQAKAKQLNQMRETTRALVASLESDILDFKDQTVLLDELIVINRDIVECLAQELNDLDTLRSQGLATTSRFSNLQQRLSDDREELLSLETAKITARRMATMAVRNRDQYLADQRSEALKTLEQARTALALGLSDYRFAVEELAVLSDDPGALTESLLMLDVKIRISGPRGDRFNGQAVDSDTKILPGDIVIVELNDLVASSN